MQGIFPNLRSEIEHCYHTYGGLAYSGSTLVSIKGVTLRRVRLILGWVTVYG